MSDAWDASEPRWAGMGDTPPRGTSPTGDGPRARPPIPAGVAYALAAVGLVAATIVRKALDPILGDASPYVTYFVTALGLFLATGLGPAMAEAFAGGLVGFYLFVEPRWSVELTKSGVGGLVLFYATVTGTLLLLRSLREARATAERRGAELAEAEAEARARGQALRATLASIADAVVATDCDGRVTFVNGVAERLLGSRAAAAVGRPMEEVVRLTAPGDGPPPAREALDAALRWGDVFAPGTPLDLAGPGGSATPVELVAAPIRAGGRGEVFGLVVVVLRDVSAALRAAAELGEARDAAEAANRSKDRFLAALGHELRTPLTPALLGVSFLLEGGDAPDSCRPVLEMIRRNIETEARLIDDLLDVVEMQRGRLVGTPRLADAHALIAEAVDICRPALDGAGVAPALELKAEPRHVLADPDRFRQAMVNLLRNSAKFSHGGGRVVVRTWTEPGPPVRLVIEVADTGLGLAPEALAALFQPFDLARRAPAAGGGGLGLGLAICRAIVDGAGGTIEASSPGPGLGATFTLALDAPAPSPRAGPRPLRRRRPEGGPLRILVVEDDEATRRAITQALGVLGHGVTTADSVASASALVDGEAPFDLLISDIGLPDGTGLDVVRRLRAVRPIPAIALSGFGLDDDLRRSREAGFSEHLVKPVDLRTLEAAIRRAAGE